MTVLTREQVVEALKADVTTFGELESGEVMVRKANLQAAIAYLQQSDEARDAERYLWLRRRFLETTLSTGSYPATLVAAPLRGCTGEESFDAAVDAHMSEDAKQAAIDAARGGKT